MTEFIFPLRVYIEDTDYSGVVFHANYLKYFERARSEWAEIAGFGMQWQRAQQLYFVIRHVSLDFLRPARLHEQIEVVTRLKAIRAASFIYDQYLRPADSNDIILAKAEVKVACLDADFRPKALPDFLQSLLNGIIAEN